MSASIASDDWGSALPSILAKRVSLQPLTSLDAPALFEIFSNLEVTRYWGSPPMKSVDDAAALVWSIQEGYRTRQLFQWGVRRRDDGQLVGTCTLLHMDRKNRRSELGFALGREHWGKGLAREAVAALIDWSFHRLRLHRLEADVDPRNERSLRLLERLGFRREGYLRERHHQGTEVQDTVMLGLLEQEWSPPVDNNAGQPEAPPAASENDPTRG